MISFTYVFPCAWEDHCKVGFSNDPLRRLEEFHQRWFDAFDLERGFLIETESERDARDLELELRRPLRQHKAPQPTTIRKAAGGHTEWLRGAFPELQQRSYALQAVGYTVYRPSRTWLAARLATRRDILYSWTTAQWSAAQLSFDLEQQLLPLLRDAMDAYAALGIDTDSWVPEEISTWYRGRGP